MKTSSKRKFYSLLAVSILLVLAFSTILVACNSKLAKDKAHNLIESTYVAIDINPSIGLVLARNNTVLSVSADNKDAEVLLWKEEGIVGASLEVAVAKIATLSAELGYIKENHDINVTVTASDNVKQQQIFATVKDKLTSSLKDTATTISVYNCVDIVLENELDVLKTANPSNIAIQNLTVSHYRLILAAMKCDRKLQLATAVTMTNEELLAVVKAVSSKYDHKFGALYNFSVEEARFAYEESKQTFLDSFYISIPFVNGSITDTMRGGLYASYRHAYRVVDHVYNSVRNLVLNPIFDDNDVLTLANILEITKGEKYDAFKKSLSDENGKVTKQSVATYLNKSYLEMSETDKIEFQKSYSTIQSLLNAVGIKADVVSAADKKTIELSITSLLLGQTVTFDGTNDTSVLLNVLQNKINFVKDEIDRSLTDKQKQEIATKQQTTDEAFDAAEQLFQSRVDAARSIAETVLDQLKYARRSA